jgi:carboxyl-terminal processing protease
MRLTVARYYTPSGRLIQKPYNKGTEEYEKDLINRYNKGELMSKDSIHFPDSLKFNTLLSHRAVYGGGGIMPDFFIPLDTTGYTDYYRDIIRKGILNKFVLTYVDKNRNEIKTKYSDFESFRKKYDVNTILSELINYAEKEGVKPDKKQIDTSKPLVLKLLKAYIARDIWDSNEFYQIYNQDDKMVLQAVEVFKNWSTMNPLKQK